MPCVIDPEMMKTDGLPRIWSPVQLALTEEEHVEELDTHSKASLLWSMDIPEAILRPLLQETEIKRMLEPPEDYDPTLQGDRDLELVTVGFQYLIQLIKVVKEPNHL
jgi:hypothetical protein